MRPTIRQNGHTRNFPLLYFGLKLKHEFLTAKFLVQCYRVLLILYLPYSMYQITMCGSIIIAFEELSDRGSDTLQYRQQLFPRSLCMQTVGLRATDVDTIMHGVAEAGLARASQ